MISGDLVPIFMIFDFVEVSLSFLFESIFLECSHKFIIQFHRILKILRSKLSFSVDSMLSHNCTKLILIISEFNSPTSVFDDQTYMSKYR